MPADKLELLAPVITHRFSKLSRECVPRGGYAHYLDLRETKYHLPVALYCGGRFNNVNKLVFFGVALLGLSRCRQIAEHICGDLHPLTISRIDWCVDILGFSVWDFAECIRIPRVQSYAFYRSRSGDSYYPHRTKQKTVLVYDRAKRLHALRDPLAKVYDVNSNLTRIEVQLRGKGVPYRKFSLIERFRKTDLLANVEFVKLRAPSRRTTSLDLVRKEGVQALVKAYGLQATAKRIGSVQWNYLSRKFLRPVRADELPDVRLRMRETVCDWLDDRIRFPRGLLNP